MQTPNLDRITVVGMQTDEERGRLPCHLASLRAKPMLTCGSERGRVCRCREASKEIRGQQSENLVRNEGNGSITELGEFLLDLILERWLRCHKAFSSGPAQPELPGTKQGTTLCP